MAGILRVKFFTFISVASEPIFFKMDSRWSLASRKQESILKENIESLTFQQHSTIQ